MKLRWQPFPAAPLQCRGLAWLDDNLPALHRLPVRQAASLPKGVREQARFPSGARLRLRSSTTQLYLRVRQPRPAAGLDVYVDGRFWRTAPLPETEAGEACCFDQAGRGVKAIDVYLPLRHELQISEWGVDAEATVEPPQAADRSRPLVLYGSSVAQGIGSARPGMSYLSILGRRLNLDHVNLGFGGAGRAEAGVVDLVGQVDACCYLLDLGKSYGRQPADAYTAMLQALRQSRPDVRLLCMTPIFSSREVHEEPYAALSEHTRHVVRQAVDHRAGDDMIQLVDGESLLGAADSDGLSGDGLHPNDLGHTRIADRLGSIVAAALD